MILRKSIKNYKTYWRTTVFSAIVFHFVGWMGVTFALPRLMPEPKPPLIDAFEWIDVDLAEESVVEAAEFQTFDENIPEPVEIPELIPELHVDAYVPEPLPELPKFELPEPVALETFKPVEKIEPKPEPIPEVKPESKDDLDKFKNELADKLKEKENESKNDKTAENPDSNADFKPSKPQMGEPPIVLKEVYPPKDGIKFGGYVSVAATIGTDGTVKKVKIMRKSGRILVDNVAMNAAKQWTFKPALDQEGKPMECDKIITFDFRKLE